MDPKLAQPELRELVAAAAQCAAESLLERTARKLRGGPAADERLAVLARLQAQGSLSIGRFTYGLPRVLAFGLRSPALEIGAFCSIAEEVEIFLDGDHRVDWVTTYPFRAQLGLPGANEDGHPASRGPVVIGNDVWLARGVTVLSGVKIGDGAVVGARAVVSRDVAPYSIVVGNPASHVRSRFPAPIVEELLALKWWDWPLERILSAVPELCADSVQRFLAKHGKGDASSVVRPSGGG